MKKFNFNIGFTLAEVLITLGIIGVVCTMTIPTLMHDIRNQQLQAQFTKAYSVLSQAVEQMKNEEGQIWQAYNYRDNNGHSGYDYTTSFQKAFEKYFKEVQDCGSSNCVSSATYYKNYNNTDFFQGTTVMSQKQFYLSDGTLVFPMVWVNPNTVISIFIDTNGYIKGPNRAGYDLFEFEILPNDTLAPEGALNTYRAYQPVYCNQDQSANGHMNGTGCAVNATSDPNYFKNLQ